MRYVAIGDSFTEGVGDERPDGSLRGWADRVAEGLASATGQPVEYANLAIRGRKLRPIVDEQLEPALALGPTLLTYNGGGNDIMRRHVDMAALTDLYRHVARRCQEAGVTLVVLAGPDPTSRIPLGAVVHRRGEALTAELVRLTDAAGLSFVDMWHDQEIRRPGYWGADRIHLNPAGHRRVARMVLAALGHPPSDDAGPAPGIPRRSLPDNLVFYREHVGPWVRRRVQGRSSGDHRTAKHPGYVSISPTLRTGGGQAGHPHRSANAWGGSLLGSLTAWLSGCGADVVCLQEVCRTTGATGWIRFDDGERSFAQRALLHLDIGRSLPDHQAVFVTCDSGPVRDRHGVRRRQDFGVGTSVSSAVPMIGTSSAFVHGRYRRHREWPTSHRPRAAPAVRHAGDC